MTTQAPKNTPKTAEKTRRTRAASSQVAEARASAQRVKLDTQAEAYEQETTTAAAALKKARNKKEQGKPQAARRSSATIARAIDDYLLDQEGGNHSTKTLEWHRTALGLMRTYFGSGTNLVIDELAVGSRIRDRIEKFLPIIPGVPQNRVLLITT